MTKTIGLAIKLLSSLTFVYISFGSTYSIHTILSGMWNLGAPCFILFLAFLSEIISFFRLDGILNQTVLRITSTLATLVAASFNVLLPKLALIEYRYLDQLPFRFGIKIQRNWSKEEMVGYLNKVLIDAELPITMLPQESKLELAQKSDTIQELNNNVLELIKILNDEKVVSEPSWFSNHYIVTGAIIVGSVLAVAACLFYISRPAAPLPDDNLVKISDKLALDIIKAQEVGKSAEAAAKEAAKHAEILSEAVYLNIPEAVEKAETSAKYVEQFAEGEVLKALMSDHQKVANLEKAVQTMKKFIVYHNNVLEAGPAEFLGVNNEELIVLKEFLQRLIRETRGN